MTRSTSELLVAFSDLVRMVAQDPEARGDELIDRLAADPPFDPDDLFLLSGWSRAVAVYGDTDSGLHLIPVVALGFVASELGMRATRLTLQKLRTVSSEVKFPEFLVEIPAPQHGHTEVGRAQISRSFQITGERSDTEMADTIQSSLELQGWATVRRNHDQADSNNGPAGPDIERVFLKSGPYDLTIWLRWPSTEQALAYFVSEP